MYDELIQRLRSDSKALFSAGWVKTSDLAKEAADAIEQLTADLERSKEWEGFWKEQAEEAKGKLQQYALAVANKPRWIPVTERLPQEDADVLAYVYWPDYGDTAICYGHWHNGWAHLFNHIEGELIKHFVVTHWCPLPEPPMEE